MDLKDDGGKESWGRVVEVRREIGIFGINDCVVALIPNERSDEERNGGRERERGMKARSNRGIVGWRADSEGIRFIL